MFFLQFFVFGAWYATTGSYMSAHGMTHAIHWAYTVGPLSALIAPFFLGYIADRFFATERVLGTLAVLGAFPLWFAADVPEGKAAWFIILILLHTLCFFPTLGLANTLAFHHIENRERQFPIVRLFGTIGWILAGVLVSGILSADTSSMPLRIAAVACLLFGLYNLSLPHTPPPARGQEVSYRKILGFDAIKRLSSVPFWTFLVCDVIVAIPYALYFAYVPLYMLNAGLTDPAFKMTFGQGMEVVIMAVLPLIFHRLGIKWMVVIGMGAWAVRYGLFALSTVTQPLVPIMGGILLHGVSFSFVFIAAQIYLDRRATPEIRGQAQGLLVMVRSGLGMLIGAQIGGFLFNNLVGDATHVMSAWQSLWIVPLVLGGLMTLAMALFFYDDSLRDEQEAATATG